MKRFAIVGVLVAYFVSHPVYRWNAYEASKLAPFGGGFFKDMTAFGLVNLPKLARIFKSPPSPESMEGFHDQLEFNSITHGKTRMKENPHFAENFYFWANNQDFLYTIRLSFYGRNASHVIPWFHFQKDGISWNLPAEFEERVPAYVSGGEREASCDLGTLLITCEKPLEHWRIRYDGIVENLSNRERRKVSADFHVYLSKDNVFKYQLHWDEMTAARSLAGKDWTPSFWTNLRQQNQERYASQANKVVGTIGFENEKKTELVLNGSRDHNFGIRNWRFIWRYIWWPPVPFNTPLEIEGIKYTYFTGAMTDYGDTFDNMVVGGLMSSDGDCASFSGATPMRIIAPEWYAAESERGVGIGDSTLGSVFDFQIGILNSRFVVDIHVERGAGAGLWQHAFMMERGEFEIHEGLSRWTFTVRKGEEVVGVSDALGLFEFGGNLMGFDDSM
mmetsp:Transcript_3505/g.5063  ORF Transcript_3505/g.5063 Transcript_3505/m.5063 type:complete len:446 (-) Transcript_3505:59-1396(-)